MEESADTRHNKPRTLKQSNRWLINTKLNILHMIIIIVTYQSAQSYHKIHLIIAAAVSMV